MPQLFVANPAGLPFVDGLDAFCFLGFSAFGLRTSRLDFFWLFAMIFSFGGGVHNVSRGQDEPTSIL
jgi:hypothetical protein